MWAWLRPLGAGLLTLWVLLTLTFFLLRLLPGGPFDQERKLPPSVQRTLEAYYHLNQPVWRQYGYFVQQAVLQGDWGPSYQYRTRRVADIVGEAARPSLLLGSLALLLGVPLGVLLGIWAALTPSPTLEKLLYGVGVAGLSTPSFLLAGGLIWLFVLRLNWLPAATLQTPAHWVLPVLTLAAAPLTWTFLVTRTALKEARLRPFIRVKDSYGLPPVWLLWRHLMPSVWLPLLSLLGPLAAALLTGSFAVETLFAIPGLGKFFVSSVVNRDYPVVMALTCLYGGLLILFNTAAEVCQAWLDPRLRGV